MGYVYLITNTINNKTYVGKTNGNCKYYYTGGLLIRRAIKKHGKENFKKEILIQGDFTDEELEEHEKYYIRTLSNPSSKTSYNITIGGGGVSGLKHTDETKQKISQSSKINSNRESHKEKISNIKYWKGKKRTKEVIAAIKEGNCKKVEQYSLDNVRIKLWDCATEANRFYHLKSGGVQAAASPKNRKKTAAGYIWKYID